MIEDFGGELDGKTFYQVMIENFAKSIIDVTKQGANIKNIYCEGVSGKGQELSRSLTKNNLLHEDKENDFILYGNTFDFNVFNRLKNFDELLREYTACKDYNKKNKSLGNNVSDLLGKNKVEKEYV